MMEPMTEAPAGARVPSTPPARPSARIRETVTAVVVTRGGTEYLPRTLAALAAQTRPVQRVVLVDAAPGARPDDLAAAVPDAVARLAQVAPTRLVTAPGVRTFGGAVRAALADAVRAGAAEAAGVAEPGVGRPAVLPGPRRTEPAERPAEQSAEQSAGDGAGWLWLLHDDSAPEPDALAALVRAVEVAPSVGVAGPKQRTWDDPARVVEVGVTTSRFGRRMTGLDEPEVDQGQHDARDDVLAVGLAGALVRRDVWDLLGGPDPALGPYGDGLDLCRRARLAGHRVVVVPRAVVRHAQASLTGGREGWDARRSARRRREAFVHSQLVGVPAGLVPVVALLAVLSGVVRALGRLVTKEPQLVVAELVAPWAVLARPERVLRARRRLRRTSRLPRRALRPLEATWRDVVGQVRDRRLAAAEARRSTAAPSELELAELAALRRRRRAGLTTVAVLAVAVNLAVLGALAGDVLGGARLLGGSLLAGDAGPADLWAAATSWWSPGGLGQASPPEPLLMALVPLAALTRGLGGATALVMLASVALAALGAWFAAGAATRSVALRAWAALGWTAAPALLVALDEARLGAVLAHLALPWFLLALARAVGAARTDSVVSGLVGAKRLAPRAPAERPGPATASRPRYVFEEDADEAVGEDAVEPTERSAAPAEPGGRSADEPAAPAAPDEAPAPDVTAEDEPADDEPAEVVPAGPPPGPLHPPSTAVTEPSLAAAAAAGLLLAVVTAAAPVLLGAVVLLLVAIAPVARRRARLVWVAVPSLALHGPVLAEAVERWSDGGWRLLVADPGVPVAAGAAAPAWQQVLGWPVPAEAWAAVPWEGPVADVAPLVASGVVLVLALPALWLRAPVGHAARIAWLAVATGVAAGLVASGVVSGVADDDLGRVEVTASAAPGLSLALAGALTAALLGATGLRSALGRRGLGLGHLAVAVLTLAAVVAPTALLGAWGWHVRQEGTALVAGDVPDVPTVGRQLQATAGLRVLRLEPAPDGVVATLLRGNGRQLTETSRAVELRRLLEGPDAADAEVADVAARLATGTATDAAGPLASLGVGAVVVPAGTGADGAALAGALDATPGLERVTSTPAGVIWRVTGATSDTAGWARVVAGEASTGEVQAALRSATGALPGAEGEVPSGPTPRLLVLAERADDGWHATADARPLRAVATPWRQAFELPAGAAKVVVEHEPARRGAWLALQGGVLLVSALLAVPLRRRRGGAR